MSATTTEARSGAGTTTCLLALAAGLVALGLLFLPECRAAVKVWSESTAYGHCYLVVPIAAYLAWDRRDSLRGLVPVPDASLLVLGLPLPFLWFASERLGIMEFRQFAALGFVELLCLVVLGRRLFRALSGPLLYLVFMVPFGAFLTPALQSFTAHFIDVGLTVLGIPHFVNDMVIEVAAGTFFVAEACAGLRFLIASIAFGVFFALLNYRSPRRRAAFIAASIIVPIVANGARALGIVLLGTVLGSAEAAAADHLIYGWVFFSFVMVLLVAAGLPMREAPAGRPSLSPGDLTGTRALPRMSLAWAAFGVLALAALAPAGARALNRNAGRPLLAAAPALIAPEGCEASPAVLDGPSATLVIRCPDRTWTATAVVVPPRSTGAALSEARGRLIGAVDPDDVVTEPLRDTPPGAGIWQAVISRKPAHVTGVAAWVRGVPARGGLWQRVNQAIDSVLGNDRPPLLIALSTRQDEKLTDGDVRDLLAALGRLVAAQPNLNAEAARITAP